MKEENDLQPVQIMEMEFQTDMPSTSYCSYICRTDISGDAPSPEFPVEICLQTGARDSATATWFSERPIVDR
jgi:hypothetical protein